MLRKTAANGQPMLISPGSVLCIGSPILLRCTGKTGHAELLAGIDLATK